MRIWSTLTPSLKASSRNALSAFFLSTLHHPFRWSISADAKPFPLRFLHPLQRSALLSAQAGRSIDNPMLRSVSGTAPVFFRPDLSIPRPEELGDGHCRGIEPLCETGRSPDYAPPCLRRFFTGKKGRPASLPAACLTGIPASFRSVKP